MIFKISKLLVDYDMILAEEREIYDYGMFVFVFNSLCIISILFLGALCHQVVFTSAFFLFFIPNRMVIGGYHCKTPETCYITFNLIFIFILLCNQLNIFSFFIIYIFCILIYICYLKAVFKHDNNNRKLIVILFVSSISITVFVDILRPGFIFSVLLNSVLYTLYQFSLDRS